jgi:hypothetical protein
MTQHFHATVRKAQRYKVKASIMIEGLTGNGKTGLALVLANALVGKDWAKVGMVDTENRSADLMVGQRLNTGDICGEFNKVDLTDDDGYAPVYYKAAAQALVDAGSEAIIFDSSTHAWNRQGGVLDMVNAVDTTRNKFAAWNDPNVVKNRDTLFELIRSSSYHVITTVRVKEKFAQNVDEVTNKSRIESLGEQQIQVEGLKYEPDLVLSMVSSGSTDAAPKARIIKSRYPMLIRDEVYEFTPALVEQIRLFLEEGADPEALLELQKQEYIKAIKDYCENRPNQKNVWNLIKGNFGYQDTKITDIPLKELKAMFLQLTSEDN